jgi:hypothetical protein
MLNSFIINTEKKVKIFPKIYLRNLRYYPPQTDILTYSKGGYGGRGGLSPPKRGEQGAVCG